MPSLRAFQKSDAEACCDIISACIAQMSGLNNAAQIRLLAKNQPYEFTESVKHCYVIVAELHNRIVGVGAIDGARLEVLFVSPDLQNQGVGSAIVQHIEQFAFRTGQQEILVETSPNAVDFYKAMGYQQQEEKHTVKDKAIFDTIRLSKPLGHGVGQV